MLGQGLDSYNKDGNLAPDHFILQISQKKNVLISYFLNETPINT